MLNRPKTGTKPVFKDEGPLRARGGPPVESAGYCSPTGDQADTNPCRMQPHDPQQCDPVSLRISVTDRCQLRCLYCMPSEGVPRRDRRDVLSFEEVMCLVRAVKSCFALSKVHITGGEPLVRPAVVDLVAMLAAENVGDLALTTNGQGLIYTAEELKRAGLRRVNVSLDSIRRETFGRLTRGGELRRSLAGIDAALESGLVPLKLNVVVMRGVNTSEIVEIARFGLLRGCHVRFLELMPIGVSKERFEDWFVSSAEVLAELATAFDLGRKISRPGTVGTEFLATDRQGGEGTLGVISSYTAPRCTGCRRLRLTATGQLVGCLALGRGPDVRALLRDDNGNRQARLAEAASDALGIKRQAPRFVTTKPMATVGG